MIFLRGATLIVGLALLLATAHLTITKTTGYHDAHAGLVLAIAAGVGVGAWTLGASWGQGRIFLAVLTFLAMVSGELFGLAQTGDRIAAERERQQGPTRLQTDAHNRAAQRVAQAQAALAAVPATSTRLQAAIAAQAAADAAVVAKSAEQGCAKNCRLLLEQQVVAVHAEVAAARAEVDNGRTVAERELADARAALMDAPRPEVSGTPLADRLGIDPATLDMMIAGFGTFGANGLAACLIAFAAHGRRRYYVAATASAQETEQFLTQAASNREPPSEEADHFARNTFRPDPNGWIALTKIREAYHRWCAGQNFDPLPDHEIGKELNALFTRVGLVRTNTAAGGGIRGIAWKIPRLIASNERRNLTYAQLVSRLAESGVKEDEHNLRNNGEV